MWWRWVQAQPSIYSWSDLGCLSPVAWVKSGVFHIMLLNRVIVPRVEPWGGAHQFQACSSPLSLYSTGLPRLVELNEKNDSNSINNNISLMNGHLKNWKSKKENNFLTKKTDNLTSL